MKLYTKKNNNAATAIEEFRIDKSSVVSTITKLKNENYLCWVRKADCTSYYLVHGFNSNSNVDWIQNIKNELFKKHKETSLINVLLLIGSLC